MRISIILIVLASLFFLPSNVSASNTLPTVLPDCVNGGVVVKPSRIVIACGDGSVYAQNLKWSGWGQSSARATGMLFQNDCTPDCAQGHFHSYKATITVYGTQRCPTGKFAYKNVRYDVNDPRWPSNRDKEYSFPTICNT